MILYFLRHGDAGAPRGDQDDARELTTAGVEALRAAGEVWRRVNLRPDVIITSPLARAEATARIASEELGLGDRVVVDERLRPGAGWSQLAQAMSDRPDARRVLFVGHEPDLSSAVALLTGASSVRLRKGGVACVEFPGMPERGSGELAWLLDPDLYATDAV